MNKTVAALAAVAALLAGCSTQPPAPEGTIPLAQPLPAENGRSHAPGVAGVNFPARDAAGALGQRSVYYDFNQYAVPVRDLPVVMAHGQFLLGHPQAHATLEGHCDERGSREYNLGLGQRRADGVRKLLEAQGVPPVQTDAVSMGSEKPFNPAHTEAAWAQNRRTDIRYRGE
ncbi:MAG: OmpA family protein [Betaproteobacteria bacterium]|nr:OmpA family protein [Betaproteobacteria bacterium]